MELTRWTTNVVHGGSAAELRKPFAAGIDYPSLLDVPRDCTCSVVVRGRKGAYRWALKYVSGSCIPHYALTVR